MIIGPTTQPSHSPVGLFHPAGPTLSHIGFCAQSAQLNQLQIGFSYSLAWLDVTGKFQPQRFVIDSHYIQPRNSNQFPLHPTMTRDLWSIPVTSDHQIFHDQFPDQQESTTRVDQCGALRKPDLTDIKFDSTDIPVLIIRDPGSDSENLNPTHSMNRVLPITLQSLIGLARPADITDSTCECLQEIFRMLSPSQCCRWVVCLDSRTRNF